MLSINTNLSKQIPSPTGGANVSPLHGGGRSCACFASYKCGEGVYPVRANLVPLQKEGLGVVQPVRATLETIYPTPEFLSSVVAKKFIPLPQGARGYNCHSEGLAEESHSLGANALNLEIPHQVRDDI